MDWKRLGSRIFGRRTPKRQPPLPDYGWLYLDHLIASYRIQSISNPAADEIISKSGDRAAEITWGDVFRLEGILVANLPLTDLVRSAWSIRARFHEVAGTAVYDRYSASGIPTETDTTEKVSLLRADLGRVLDALHFFYAFIPLRETIRTSLTESCIRMVVGYSIILGGFLTACYFYRADFLAMLAAVLYCGTIGGFVSSQRRMQNIPSEGDPLVSTYGLANSSYYLWLSPLLGAVFAVVLAMMFMAGFLKGSVFPEFAPVDSNKNALSFFMFTWRSLPTSGENYEKLLVWSFAAGFAERLVPDSLDRLTSRTDASRKDAIVPAAPATPLSTPDSVTEGPKGP